MYYVAGAAIIGMMLFSTADMALRAGGPLYSKLGWWILGFGIEGENHSNIYGSSGF